MEFLWLLLPINHFLFFFNKDAVFMVNVEYFHSILECLGFPNLWTNLQVNTSKKPRRHSDPQACFLDREIMSSVSSVAFVLCDVYRTLNIICNGALRERRFGALAERVHNNELLN